MILTGVIGVSVLGMLAGCGSSDSEKKEITAVVSESAEEAAETVEAATESEAEEEEAAPEEEKKAAEKSAVSIEEQVLVDKDGIKITATEYTEDDFWGEGIRLLIENNTDKTYMIGCDALIVNDYMISDLFSSEISAGKKANETMYLSTTELEAAGIDTVGKVEIYFHAFDSEDWSDSLFQKEFCEVKTSEYENMDTTPNDAGMELYNEGGIKIVGKTVDENSFWGTAILLYTENTSDQDVSISVEEMSINGFMIDPLYSSTCYAGKKSIEDITVLSEDLESNGIESIEEVELKFHIYDADSYETIADSEAITFSAQ